MTKTKDVRVRPSKRTVKTPEKRGEKVRLTSGYDPKLRRDAKEVEGGY